jgi:hypothetical protein
VRVLWESERRDLSSDAREDGSSLRRRVLRRYCVHRTGSRWCHRKGRRRLCRRSRNSLTCRACSESPAMESRTTWSLQSAGGSNEMMTAVVVAVAVWLGILTLAVLLLVRQLGIISVRLQFAGRLGIDGPAIGNAVGPGVVRAHPPLRHGLHYLLFVSGACGACHELVPALAELGRNAPVVVLAGQDELADHLAAVVPSEVSLVRDPEATTIGRGLNINATPLVIEVDDGVVSGRALANTPGDIARLIEARTEPTHPSPVLVSTGG